MNNKRRWVRNSAKTYLFNNTSFFYQTLPKLKEGFSRKQSKHTFFPGNEQSGSRLSLNTKYILDSDSIIKVLWDIIVMILTIILSYAIPYSVAFYVDFPLPQTRAIISIYLIDMLLTFNTSIYSKGMKLENRYKIAKYYLKTWFWLDLLSSFPFEFFFMTELDHNENYPVNTNFASRDGLRYLLLLKLLRLFKYKKMIFSIQQLFPIPSIYNLTSVLTYLFGTSLVLHWITCCFNVIYCNSLDTAPDMHHIQPDNRTRYLKIFLRAIETVTGVGYGELPNGGMTEKIFQIFIMTLTSGLMGYIVGGIQSSIEKLNFIDYYFNDIIRKMKIYCELNECPGNLRKRIINYIRNLKKLHSENLLREQDVLSLLSAPMKEEVYANIQGHYLLRLNAFTLISNACLKAISYKLKLQVYAPNDLIINQGEITNDLYFVIGGNVEVFHRKTQTVFKLLPKHSFFGEIGFFINVQRTASVKSFEYSELLKISSFDFLVILKSLPKDFDVIKALIRNIKIYGVAILDIRCYLCYSLGHCAIDCNLYVYKKNLDYSSIHSNKIPKNKVFDHKTDFIKRFNIHSVKGKPKHPSKMYEKKPILVAASDSYINWTNTMRKKSQHLISLLGSMEDIREESEDSGSSEEIFKGYQAGKGDKLRSFYSDSSVESHR